MTTTTKKPAATNSAKPAAKPESVTSTPKPATKLINIALQGGGSHGAYAWGVLDRLLADDRLEFDALSATSAGAMNAAVVTCGLAQGGREGARKLLRQFWTRISEVGQKYAPVKTPFDDVMHAFGVKGTLSGMMFDTITRTMSPYQFNPMNVNPLRDVLCEVVDFEAIQKYDGLKLRICATNVRSGKIKIFRNPEVTAEAVLASACLPHLFQAVEIGNEAYWDGGYMGNPAIYPLIYDGKSQDVVIIHINPIWRDDVPTTAPEMMNRLNEISFNSSLMREMRAISFVSKMVDEGWIKDEFVGHLKRIYIHSIRADEALASYGAATKTCVESDFLHTLFAKGQQEAELWLGKHFNQIGVESSIDINKEFL